MTKSRWMAAVLGLGCAACCAPLILPLVLGGGLAGGGILAGLVACLNPFNCGLSLSGLLCDATMLGMIGTGLWLMVRKPAAKPCDCADTCEPGCKV